jgi:hypothetical protein
MPLALLHPQSRIACDVLALVDRLDLGVQTVRP